MLFGLSGEVDTSTLPLRRGGIESELYCLRGKK